MATALYAAPSLSDVAKRNVELAALPWVGPDDSLGDLASARWLDALSPMPQVVCRTNSVLALAVSARAGVGAAALPCFLADPEPGLVRIRPPLPALATELWLLTHRDLRRVARIRAFTDFMARSLGGSRALLEGRRPAGRTRA